MVFKNITLPLDYPVSIQEAKAQLRVDWEDENVHILSLIHSATQTAEQYMWRTLVDSEWEMKADFFKREMIVPRGGVTAVTEINYIDTLGNAQILDPSKYSVDTISEPARIMFNELPSVSDEVLNAVTIKFRAGATDTGEIPAPIKQGILLIVAHLFEHREDVSMASMHEIPMGSKHLFNPYRVFLFR